MTPIFISTGIEKRKIFEYFEEEEKLIYYSAVAGLANNFKIIYVKNE